MATIELDIAYDCDHNTVTKDMAKRHGCNVTLLKEHGPAGGNPLYLFTGTRQALKALIKEYDGENGEADYLFTHIKE